MLPWKKDVKMKTNYRTHGKVLFAVAMALAIAACAPTKQSADFKLADGFLPKPALLKPGKEDQAALVYIDPTVNFPSYGMILIEPVMVWTTPGTAFDKVPAEQRQAMANDLYAHLHKKISAVCDVVDAPGAGVMRIRVALIDAEQSDPVANTISTYVPQAHVLNLLSSYAFNGGVGVFTGSATAEGYATDSVTGRVLWEGADKRAGSNAIGTDTLNSWEDVYNTFDAWSDKFAKRLLALGACQ
jgi:hypothetical protein